MGEICASPSSLRHNQQVQSQLVQTSNANTSSVNDMFKVVPVIFQHIMTELNGAKPKEDRIMTITKSVLNYRITVIQFVDIYCLCIFQSGDHLQQA
jgi:hypothetical protein